MVSTLLVVIILVSLGLVALAFYYWRKQQLQPEPTAPTDLRLHGQPASYKIGQSCSAWGAQLSWTPSTGYQPITYTWTLSKNGRKVVSGTTQGTSSTVLSTQQVDANTTYTAVVVATNAKGSASSAPVQVTVGGAVTATTTHLFDQQRNRLIVVAKTSEPITSADVGSAGFLQWSGSSGVNAETYLSGTEVIANYAAQSNAAFNLVQGGTTVVSYAPVSGAWSRTDAGSTTTVDMPDDLIETIGDLGTGSLVFTTSQTPFAYFSNGALCLSSTSDCSDDNTLAWSFTNVASLMPGQTANVSMTLNTEWSPWCNLELQFIV